jgi:hypothetical protein
MARDLATSSGRYGDNDSKDDYSFDGEGNKSRPKHQAVARTRPSSSSTSTAAAVAATDQKKKNKSPLKVFNKLRYKCGAIVNNEDVQFFVVLLIFVNAVTMGIATFDFITENPARDQAFERVDMAFLIIFTIELAMQFIFIMGGGYSWMDGWSLIWW